MKTHLASWLHLVQRMPWYCWLLVCWLVPGSSWAQTIVSENFNGAWTTPATLTTAGTTGTWGDDGATGDQQWHRNDYTTGWTPNSNSNVSPYDADGAAGTYAAFHSTAAASGSTGALVSPVLDFSGYANNKILLFNLQNTIGTDVVNVYLSTDGGLTYGSSLGTYGAALSGFYNGFRLLLVDLGPTTSSTVRVKFVATSDAGLSDIGLDNFRVVNRVREAFSGLYTIDNALPNAGTNFTSFADAVALLNFMGVGGPTTFSVANGQSFGERTPPLTASGTAGSPLVFREATLTATFADNPTILVPGSTNSFDAGLILSGADYVTIDGINIQNAGTFRSAQYGYVVSNASATNGATYNTIRNAAISLTRAAFPSTGLTQNANSSSFGGAAATASSGTNQHNSYYNLQFRNMTAGVNLTGASADYPDYDTQLYNCAIGDPSVSADIGGSQAGAASGVSAYFQSKLSLHDNVLRNIVVTTGNTRAAGLTIVGSCGTGPDASNVYNNQIGTVGNTRFNPQFTFGIQAGTASSGTHTLNLYNNFVWDLVNGYSSTPVVGTRYIAGIYIGSEGTTDQTVNVSFNSVRIAMSSAYTASSTCYEISSAIGAVVNTRNNVFANVSAAASTANTTARHYVWVSPVAGTVGAAGSISNYNDLYVTNTTNFNGATVGFVGLGGTTTYATLADWQAATSQDANSVAVDPLFLSATDLHLQSTSPLFGLGTPLAGIATDIDNAPRSATAPAIGADDLGTAPLPVVLTAFEAVRQGPDAALTWATASEQHNQGFEVQVSLAGTTFRPLAFVAGVGTSSTAHTYAYLDREAGKSGVRYYRLWQLDLDGTSTYSPVRAVHFDGEVVARLTGAPNPFHERLTLALELPVGGATGELGVYDITGRRVLRQQLSALPAGASQVEVAGVAELGSGVYFVQVVVPGQLVQHVRVVRQ